MSYKTFGKWLSFITQILAFFKNWKLNEILCYISELSEILSSIPASLTHGIRWTVSDNYSNYETNPNWTTKDSSVPQN